MNKQNALNIFLDELGSFLEKYYSSQIIDIKFEENEHDSKSSSLYIFGEEDSVIELSSEGEEITCVFSESHWHIDDYNDPCDLENIYENTIDSVMEILNHKVGTYSCWKEGSPLGGATFCDSSPEEIIKECKNKYFKNLDELRIKTWSNQIEIIKV